MQMNRTATWANPSYRIIGWIWVSSAGFLAIALILAPGMKWWAAGIVGGIFAVFGIVGWHVYGRTNVTLYPEAVIVRNPLRTVEVPIDNIAEIGGGQHLVLELKDGSCVRAWAVQAANASLLSGRRSYVDLVASELKQSIQTQRPVAIAVSQRDDSLARKDACLVGLAAIAGGLLRLIL